VCWCFVRTADGKCRLYVDPADKLQNTDLQWVCTPTNIASLHNAPISLYPELFLQQLVGIFQAHFLQKLLDTVSSSAIIIIIIIINIVIFVITFVQGIYNYIPERNYVSRLCSVTAVLYLQFMLHVMLFPMFNMFCTCTLALPAVCVCSAQYGCFL
jgi:hypothetical protein